MSYAVLMVYVEPDGTPEARVHLAAGLADKFTAKLIGLSARIIPSPIVADGMLLEGPTEVDVQLMAKGLAEKGTWFQRIADSERRKIEWRSALELRTSDYSRGTECRLVVIGQGARRRLRLARCGRRF
jgi:hypothetical protein